MVFLKGELEVRKKEKERVENKNRFLGNSLSLLSLLVGFPHFLPLSPPPPDSNICEWGHDLGGTATLSLA